MTSARAQFSTTAAVIGLVLVAGVGLAAMTGAGGAMDMLGADNETASAESASAADTPAATETATPAASDEETETPTPTATPTPEPTETATPTPTDTSTTESTNASAAETAEDVRYYQVDLVVGEPIKEFGPNETDNYYSDQQRLVRYLHGSSEEPVRRNGTSWRLDAEYQRCFESHDIKSDGETATATFEVSQGCAMNVTLVSYEKPGPGYDREMATQEEFIEAHTLEAGPGIHALTVDVTPPEESENATSAEDA